MAANLSPAMCPFKVAISTLVASANGAKSAVNCRAALYFLFEDANSKRYSIKEAELSTVRDRSSWLSDDSLNPLAWPFAVALFI